MSNYKDLFEKCSGDGGYFGTLRAMGDTFITRPTMQIIPDTHIKFGDKDCIMWSYNNYLGLANHPEVQEVAEKSLAQYGLASPMGSRMMSGTTLDHLALEKKFAKWTKKEAAYIFNYGYMGVLGVVSALVAPEDTIVMDKLAHASIIDAAFLASGTTRIFKHNNVRDLEKVLKNIREKKPNGGILILIEGVYGMTGDIAPLKEIVKIKNKYGARLFIDDAHGCGVIGEQGRGVGDYHGVMDEVDIYFGTFAKTFGAIGGFASATKEVIEWITYNARTQIFAKSLPIVYVHALDKTLDLIIESDERRKKLWEMSNKLKDGLRNEGFYIGPGESPIVSTYISIQGDQPYESVAPVSVKYLRNNGIFVSIVIYPVIPRGLIMYRMIPTAVHTDEDIATTIKIFKQMKHDLHLSTTMTETELDLLKRIYVEN